jgi:phosphatidylglycerol---prolipoprotein diacylglyceryl transferase
MTTEFWNFWHTLPGRIDPVIFELGWFRPQYYGLMYIVAFAITHYLALTRVKHENRFHISTEQVQDISTTIILGIIIGGRLGYVLFYNFSYYLEHPLEIILPFQFNNGITFTGITGMSFHGGLVGTLLGVWFYIRKSHLDFRDLADLYAPVAPLGYTFGRIGNFINGELYGRVTSLPIGMHFPMAPGNQLRHPSQLYEAFFEGIFLFVVLWNLRKRKTPRGAMLAFYLMGYGVVRFCIEFTRQPDAHLGFIWLSFSMGQLLCGAMIISGGFLYLYYRR